MPESKVQEYKGVGSAARATIATLQAGLDQVTLCRAKRRPQPAEEAHSSPGRNAATAQQCWEKTARAQERTLAKGEEALRIAQMGLQVSEECLAKGEANAKLLAKIGLAVEDTQEAYG